MAPVALYSDVLSRLLSYNPQDGNNSGSRFLEPSTRSQQPKVLWIGCADSRIPEGVEYGCEPGVIFVHRNIANQLRLDDINALSVLQYGIVQLPSIEEVVIVGHTNCGGAKACLKAVQSGSDIADSDAPGGADAPINRWLAPLLDIAASLQPPSTASYDPTTMLVEESVKVQVMNVCQSETISSAWASGRKIWVHGWIYEIANGTMRDLSISQGPR